MAKSKYSTIASSSVYTDASGNFYPDIFTFPINNIVLNDKPLKYYLEQQDIERFDILMANYYGSSDYDQIILWLNKIGHIADQSVGTEIYLPSKNDLDTFLLNYSV